MVQDINLYNFEKYKSTMILMIEIQEIKQFQTYID